MVADVLLTVIGETDAEALGRLINEMAESARQLHVGSALIGEPGAPKLPNDLTALFDAVMKTINIDVLLKARTAVADLKGQAHGAMTDALSNHPDLLGKSIATKSGEHNARIRAISHRLAVLEAFVPEVINNALGEAAANLDVQEGANIINTLTLLAIRMLESRPDEVNDRATSLIDALDIYGLSELAEKTGEVIGGALRPLARSVVPSLARGVLNSLATDDDEFEAVAEEARHLLVALIKDGKADHNG